MASISIHDLRSTGADFFTDSESYMHELSEAELSQQGGLASVFVTALVFGSILLFRAC